MVSDGLRYWIRVERNASPVSLHRPELWYFVSTHTTIERALERATNLQGEGQQIYRVHVTITNHKPWDRDRWTACL